MCNSLTLNLLKINVMIILNMMILLSIESKGRRTFIICNTACVNVTRDDYDNNTFNPLILDLNVLSHVFFFLSNVWKTD